MDEITNRSAGKASLGLNLPQPAPDIEPAQPIEFTPLAQPHGQLKRAARRRLPRALFDFVEGGSYDEVTLRANVEDFAALRLRQRVLCEHSTRKLGTKILGERARIPVALAPIGLAGLLRPRGEIQAARAAAAFGVPFCLSTFSVCSVEEVAAAVASPFFFQLYMFKDRGINATLIERAEKAGCSVLVLTVDTAVHGRRNRDLDNGLTVPVKVRPRHVYQVLTHPRWAIGWLMHNRTMGNLAMFVPGKPTMSNVTGWAQENYLAASPAEMEWVRERWGGKIVVKGVLDPEDAKLAVSLGADAIVVSNHGGRQLDGALSSAMAFPAIRDAVGDEVELLIDSGVSSGLDVLKALGLGAKACLIGRAYLYGLAAYGEAGVTTVLQLMAQELDAAMALTGVDDVHALPEGLVIGA
jgi:L-lactate dehydrogenase (cytochrome)